MMLFGEKYPDPVRMITMGEFSRELCGGTHLDATNEVGVFEIISEESVAAGTRRITALTGTKAKQHREAAEATISQVAKQLGVEPVQVPAAVAELSRHVRELKKQLDRHDVKATKLVLTQLPAADGPIPQLLHAAASALKVATDDVAERVEALVVESTELEKQIRGIANV